LTVSMVLPPRHIFVKLQAFITSNGQQ
jgi:hypothetical protein